MLSDTTRGTAIVTGAAQGLGRTFAEALAASGHAIAMLDVAECDMTLDVIERNGGLGISFVGDAADPADVSAFRDLVQDRLPPVRVLVNNAGISPYAPFSETSIDDWHGIMRVNLDSAFLLTQAFLDDLIASGAGRIVNLTSTVVWDMQVKNMSAYVTSKAGIVGFTRALASELGVNDITVNCIAPGIVLTPDIEERVSTESLEAYRGRQAIKSLARPIDLVSALEFLVSESSGQVTATVLPVNGGASFLVTVNRMGIRGIDHIGITVPNLDEAIEFFIRIFGAEVLVRHPPYNPNPAVNVNNFARHPETAVNGIALIEIAGSLLELLEYDAPDRREEFPRTSDSGGHHVAFYVEDMDETLDQLRQAGVEILGDPLPFAGDESGPRARFVYTRAPWGLFIELVTYPEGKSYQHR